MKIGVGGEHTTFNKVKAGDVFKVEDVVGAYFLCIEFDGKQNAVDLSDGSLEIIGEWDGVEVFPNARLIFELAAPVASKVLKC